MLIKMYEGTDEVLLFQTDDSGHPIGANHYFKGESGDEGDRNRDDFDVSLVELPISITTRIKAEPERVLT